MTAEQNKQGPEKSHWRAFAVGSTAVLGAAVTLSAAFNAFAHVPSAAKNQQQHNLLAPYTGFIMHMEKKPDQWGNSMHCCGMQDGVGNIPEIHTDYPAAIDSAGQLHASPNGSHYHVKLTKTQTGEPLPNGGFWLDVPDDRILDGDQAARVCAQHADDATCKAPPFNILWYGVFDESSPYARPGVYCLWPAPRLQ